MQIDLAELRARLDREHEQWLEFIQRAEAMFEPAAPVQVTQNGNGTIRAALPTKPKARAQRQSSQRASEVGRSLREPFSTAHLAASMGVTDKAASSQIHRWKRAGWVVSNVPGQYTRTRAFGGASEQGRQLLQEIKGEIAIANPRA